MKAAILSINLHTRRLNYGAVLHSWFFQQLMLRRPDVESCEIIDYLPAALEGVNLKRWYLDGSTEKGLRFRLRDLCNTMAYLRRYARFERFFQRRLQVSAERYTQASLRAANLPYDVIFLESDVIWSPVYFRGRFDPAFFGALESMRNLQKIVYAASMGQAELTQEQKRELRGLLEAPDAISMRETYAARLVREQTDKPVADVVDPVLLAQIEDFARIMSPRRVRGRYLLVYFPVDPDRYVLDCAHAYARAHGLKVVEVSDHPLHILRNRTYASASIETFVSLVCHAEMVFCNSLHGVCLSILFNREFYAFSRPGGGEKYRDLARKFGLEDRYIEKNAFQEAEPIRWAEVNARREELRSESLTWLDEQIVAAAAALLESRKARV